MLETQIEKLRMKINSYYLSESVIIAKPISEVFKSILNDMDKHYSKIAEGHQKFEVIGGDSITEGMIIACEEVIHNMELKHQYEVLRIIPNEHIYYSTNLKSNPTQVIIKSIKQIEDKSGTDVYFDFEEIDSDSTKVTQTLVTQMSSKFSKFMGTITGLKKQIRNHLKEELHGLKREIENVHTS